MLSEYKLPAFDDQGWVSRMCLHRGFAGLPSEPTFEAIHEQMMTAGTSEHPRPAVPEGLYEKVQELARLRSGATKEQRERLDGTLPSHVNSHKVFLALLHALERSDKATVRFLLDTGLVERFKPFGVDRYIEMLRRACKADS